MISATDTRGRRPGSPRWPVREYAVVSLGCVLLLGAVLTAVVLVRLGHPDPQSRGSVALALAGGLILLCLCLLRLVTSVTREARLRSATHAYRCAHDGLTGMPNRDRFATRASAALRAATPHHLVAIAVVDLDRFRAVNDTFGHDLGDQVILELADRLHSITRPGDTSGRLGGDEFGLVLTGVASAYEVEEILATVRRTLTEPLPVNGIRVTVGASAGYAMAPDDGTEYGDLLQCADLAMDAAKREPGQVRRWSHPEPLGQARRPVT